MQTKTKTKNIVLYNDNTLSFQEVIVALVNVCGHEPVQAEQCATIVHNNGKCKVKEGTYMGLLGISRELIDCGLRAIIE